MLQLITAQDEKLLGLRLVQDIEKAALSPLATQWLVIGNHASKTWLQQQMAASLGICAGYAFIQPGSLVWQTLSLAGVDIPATPQFDARVLRWRVADCLQRADQPMDLTALAEAEEYAKVIDRYLHYRPGQMKEWAQKPPANDKVAAVWHQLVQRFGEQHPQILLEKIRPGSREEQKLRRDLPQTIRVFNPQQLSNIQFYALQLLSRLRPVSVYLKNPAPEEFWFDIKDVQQQLYEKLENPVLYEYYDRDNLSPLLEQFGRQKAGLLNEFFRQEEQFLGFEPVALTEKDRVPLEKGAGVSADSERAGTECSDLNGQEHNLLASVRQDLAEAHSTPEYHPVDDSIRVHACHNRRRELEVARDDILDAIQNLGLEPSDVLVLAPDINDYSEWIEPVFNQSPLTPDSRPPRAANDALSHNTDKKQAHLPWHIDRMRVQDAPAARALLALLQTLDGRLGATEVMDLLLHQPVREQFDLDESELALLESWVQRSAIRWGQDAAHRQELGFYPGDINTWAFGSDRWAAGLLLGESDLSLEVLETHGDLEGNEAVFAAFFDFFDALARARNSWQLNKTNPLTAEGWYDWIRNLMRDFMAESDPTGFEQAMAQLHKVLVKDSDGTTPVLATETVLKLTEEALSERAFRSAGEIGVRFQSWENACLGPARLVFVLGMNASEFPGREPFSDMDMTRTRPWPLDKNRRLRDKNLFLDLLSERLRRLAFSYQGFSEKDNEDLAPAGPLDAFLEYLDDKTGGQFQVIKHRMHGFHPAYFGLNLDKHATPLFSYQNQALQQARLATQPKRKPSPQHSPKLRLERELSLVTLDHLVSFFTDPLKHFLRHGLAVRLNIGEEQLPEEENWQLDGLDKYRAEALAMNYPELEPHRIQQLLHLDGLLPDSPTGRLAAADFADHAGEMLAEKRRYRLSRKGFRWQAPEDWPGAVREMSGEVSVTPQGQLVNVVMGSGNKKWLKPKDLLRHWLAHVFYAPDTESWLMAPGQCVKIQPLDQPAQVQRDILAWFESGSQRPWFVRPQNLFEVKPKKAKKNSVDKEKPLTIYDDKKYFKEITDQAAMPYNRHLAMFLTHYVQLDKAQLNRWREQFLGLLANHMQYTEAPHPMHLANLGKSPGDENATTGPQGGLS